MIITKSIEFDMGHRVPYHKSKCKNLHGHRYKVEVGVEGSVIKTKKSSDEGMVIDFGDLKEVMMKEIHDKLDHGFMMYDDDPFVRAFAHFAKEEQKVIFVPFIPTAENIAKFIFEKIGNKLKRKNMKLDYVRVWETPSSSAVYRKG